MPSAIQLKAPGGVLIYQFDWTREIPAGAQLQSVQNSAPAPLNIVEELIDPIAGLSAVRVGGGAHGGLYVVTALATLTTNETIPGQFTLRVMQPPNSVDV